MFGKIKTTLRKMAEEDINNVIPFYIEYYNNNENSEWTTETTYKRIHQVWSERIHTA